MARPQSFDRAQVLSKALQVFWRKGFEGTTIQDLVDATGLNRGSLYNTFGDKEALFAEVMALYRMHSPANILVHAPKDSNVFQLFYDFFQALIQRAELDTEHRGCLLTNTAAGFYGCSEDLTDWVCLSFENLETLFVDLIKRGQRVGELSSQSPPLPLARFLISSAQGINVMARTGSSRESLQDIVDQIFYRLAVHSN